MKFYRQLIAMLLLVGILTNCFSYWILSASYSFNKKYISTVLCSNISHPEKHCEGKCFLHIKLKELEQKNKHDQDNIKRIIETDQISSVSLVCPVYTIPIADLTNNYLQKKPTGSATSIFQPPKATFG
jgi:hypothetical protein